MPVPEELESEMEKKVWKVKENRKRMEDKPGEDGR
jgi:hypothetical protein